MTQSPIPFTQIGPIFLNIKPSVFLTKSKLSFKLFSNTSIRSGLRGVKFEDIISKINGNIFIVSVDSDLFFTDYQNRETFYKACRIKENIFFKTIKSVHGHDAFLIEFDQMKQLLSQIFIKKHVSMIRN